MQMQKPLISFFMLVISLLIGSGAWADNPFSKKSDGFLSADQAFKVADISQDTLGNLQLDLIIADGYYLYKSKTRILDLSTNQYTLSLPQGKVKEDEYFGRQEVYYGSAIIKLNFHTPFVGDILRLEMQGCSEKGLCYPPTIRKIAYTPLPINNIVSNKTLSESESIATTLTDKNFILSLLGFFVSGLLLSLTPCVLPMLPILSGIILSSNVKNAKQLTIFYVLGVCLTYTILGVIAGITGNLLSSSMQNTNFIMFSSLLFIFLAISMFDVVQLTLPKFITNTLHQLSQKTKGGNFIGVFFLGLFSSLILSPCVAPPLAGAILYIGHSENIFLGGASLFFMSLGLSAPLILIGFSSKTVLPKPGPWMNSVKKLMAYILLAMALYIARPLMNELIFFSGLLILLIITLLSLILSHAFSIQKTIGFIVMLCFVILGGFLMQKIVSISSQDQMSKPENNFINIRSVEEFNFQLGLADNTPVLVDFYADWCVACLEYEKHTFRDDNVKMLLSKFILLKADVTENNASHQTLLKKFNLYGPPGIIFYKNQQELDQYQVVGYKNATEFSKILEMVLNHRSQEKND
jgi:thioredoxin:protein disulfide reductase